jgi:chaperonin GroES
MVKLKPQGNRILIKPEKAQTSQGGIILPENAQEKPKQGKVVKVGPGTMNKEGRLEAISLNEGDQVVYSSYAGTEVTLDGEDYLIMSEEDVYGVLSV